MWGVQCRYDMSTSLALTKWPPNFRIILICYVFYADDFLSSISIPDHFMNMAFLISNIDISLQKW